MPSFTREQLRGFTTNSANFTAQDYTFTLVNNTKYRGGFSMEGDKKTIFDSASISSLNNCVITSGSTQAIIAIDPNATATFIFTPTATLTKDQVLFRAPNGKNISGSTTTFFGVNLTISP